MFAGKTEWLINWCANGAKAGLDIKAFRPRRDRRDEQPRLLSHSGMEFPATIIENDLCGFPYQDISADIYVFDETQFFHSIDLLITIELLMFKHNKGVLIGGLCQDAFGKPFGVMPTLLSMADMIWLLRANCSKCRTQGNATRTYRKTKELAQTVVGGAEMYEPRCFKCWRDDDDKI